MGDLKHWRGVARPQRQVIEGAYARLEPLDPEAHAAGLFSIATAEGAEERFRYLFDSVPASLEEQTAWAAKAASGADPLFFAVIDRATGKVGGRQALMRIDAHHGVIEIGSVLWGPSIRRSRVATEALFLMAEHVFALGYRRFEWKCDSRNEPSRRAACRFGFRFEGIFRQHLVVKGQNRDTAWFSMLDHEWPALRAEYLRWLAPGNFDATAREKTKLACRAEA